jgi:hypothetical protein
LTNLKASAELTEK